MQANLHLQGKASVFWSLQAISKYICRHVRTHTQNEKPYQCEQEANIYIHFFSSKELSFTEWTIRECVSCMRKQLEINLSTQNYVEKRNMSSQKMSKMSKCQKMSSQKTKSNVPGLRDQHLTSSTRETNKCHFSHFSHSCLFCGW